MENLPLVPLFAVADRLFGAGKPAFRGKKAVILLAVCGVGFLIAGVTGLLFGVGWFVYRALPFPHGSQTPRQGDEFAKALLRHAPAILIGCAVAYWRGLSVPYAGAVFAGYVVAALILAALYGRALTKAEAAGVGIGDEGAVFEVIRGAAFGVATWLTISPPL